MIKRIILFVCALAAFSVGAAQCRATTKKGTQCKRQATPSSQYCWQHGGKSQGAQKTTAFEEGAPVAPVSTSDADASPSIPSVPVVGNDSEKDLSKENETLRRENQKLRRELVRQKEGEPVIDMSGKHVDQKKSEQSDRIVDDGGWWLSSTGKRHNSKCRYYKTGKGRPCEKADGTACKKCGG